MRSHALALSLVLAAALPLAAGAAPKGAAKPAASVTQGHGDPELHSLRRQLASAVLVSELKLTGEQKKALRSVILEAKSVRDEVKNDPDLATFRADRKAALKAALDEVHAKGSLSDATKKSLKEGAKGAPADRDDVREKMKSLKESVKGILTAEQMEKIRQMREKRAEKLGQPGFEKKAGVPGKDGDGRRMLRLLMSDEFAAELER